MDRTITGIFRDPREAANAADQLRELGLDGQAVRTEEKKGGFLEALLPDEQRSDQVRLTVSPGNRVLEVRRILERKGALRIEDSAPESTHSADGLALSLAEEELYPKTTVVQVGEVVVRKTVVTEMRTFEVPVRREEIVVERSVLNQPLAAPAGNRFEAPVTTEAGEMPSTGMGADDELIRIPILEEQVTVEKHPVVREELRILKRRVQEVVRISEEVRREEPVVEHERP